MINIKAYARRIQENPEEIDLILEALVYEAKYGESTCKEQG